MSGSQRKSAAEMRAWVASIDPDLAAAADDVDETLLAWTRSLTLRQRLDACTRATRSLSQFLRVPPHQR